MRTRSRIDPRRTPSARPPPQLGSASQWKVAPPSTSGRGCRWDRKRKAAAMVLHKVPPRLWPKLRLQEGICARLPAHFLAQLNDDTQPTPVHWRPLGVRYRRNPRTGERERVQDVPVPVFLPRAADEGLWGGEGWIRGFRYANNDKVRPPSGCSLGSARLGAVRFVSVLTALCPPAALHASAKDLEAAAVQAAVLQRDPGRQAHHHRHHAHAGPHRPGLWL